jgi:N-acetylated-alpha-linked acidic dipeptidase
VDVIGRIEGARWPEQTVIVGAHHDAWAYGAEDPLSGTIVVVEAARALAAAARECHRPARTVLFCGWDAEEFGIIGSAEWVEAHAAELGAGAVAYVNLDAAVRGWNFSASASPALQALIWEATREVEQPTRAGGGSTAARESVFDAWSRRVASAPRATGTPGRRVDQPVEPRDDGMPSIGTLGGGSDHGPFLTHLGIPSAGFNMGGAPGTAYHSMYDDLVWYRKSVGDDYGAHAAMTRVVALVAARLADADVIPYDPGAAARDAASRVRSLADKAREAGVSFDSSALEGALGDAAGASVGAAARVAALVARAPDDAALTRVNAGLIAVERAWLDERGLPRRPWRRNVFMAPDENSGYASWPLPAIRGGIERKDAAETREGLSMTEAAARRVADRLRELAAP